MIQSASCEAVASQNKIPSSFKNPIRFEHGVQFLLSERPRLGQGELENWRHSPARFIVRPRHCWSADEVNGIRLYQHDSTTVNILSRFSIICRVWFTLSLTNFNAAKGGESKLHHLSNGANDGESRNSIICRVACILAPSSISLSPLPPRTLPQSPARFSVFTHAHSARDNAANDGECHSPSSAAFVFGE